AAGGDEGFRPAAVFTMPVADARRARRRQLVVDPPRVEMVKVEDDLVPGRWAASGCAGTGHARTPGCRANATIWRPLTRRELPDDVDAPAQGPSRPPLSPAADRHRDRRLHRRGRAAGPRRAWPGRVGHGPRSAAGDFGRLDPGAADNADRPARLARPAPQNAKAQPGEPASSHHAGSDR